MPWKELARTALLGTAHSALPASVREFLAGQSIPSHQEETTLLLEAAAILSQVRKAGFQLHDFTGELPELVADNDHPGCSIRSTHHLNLILEGRFSKVLPEFIHHLLENGKCIPTSQLPALLERSDIDQWWELIQPALGPAGYWLIRQHPQWSERIKDFSAIDWQTASKEDRLKLMDYLRRTDPEKALHCLMSTWETEDYRHKAAFLKTWQAGLSQEDENFLEDCLKDSRKEVRLEAAVLLARIPGADYGERMFGRAMDMMTVHKGKLVVNPPDEPDESALKDGLLKVNPDWKGGKRAAYLGQVVSTIHPGRWESWLNLKPSQVLETFDQSDWSETLLLAIARAAIFHDSGNWIGKLVEYWFEEELSPLWNSSDGRILLKNAPPHLVNRLCLDYLQRTAGLPDENSPVYQLLLVNDAPWEDDLTLELMERLKSWLAKNPSMDWRNFHFRHFLSMAAIRSHPDLLGSLQKGWNTQAYLWIQWEKPVEEMLNTLLFRKEMINELTQ